jgi:hypothetical protein
VRASNAAGVGAPSAAVTFTTPPPVAIAPGSFVFRVDASGKPDTFAIPRGAMANTDRLTMSIRDIWGRTVWQRTIHPAESKVGEITWNGRNSSGRQASAGIYVVNVTVTVGEQVSTYTRKGVTLRPR